MSQVKVTVTVRPGNDRVNIVDIGGQVTSAADAALSSAFERASAAGVRTVILNFGDLDYMNSSGIGIVVTLLIRANRQNQRLFAVGLNEHYRDIFEITRLDEAIRVFETEKAALDEA